MTSPLKRVASRGRARATLVGVVVAVVMVVLFTTVVGGAGEDVMSADDAVTFTDRALTDAGVEATVGTPSEGTFEGGARDEDVWVVPAEVRGQQIAISVDADGDKALNLADRLSDGSNVLSDEEFEALAQFRFDPRAEGAVVPATAALALALAVGLLLGAALRTGRAALPAL